MRFTMKQYIIILQYVFFVLLQGFLIADGADIEDTRKWLEIDKTLYRIESQGKYTWKQADVECKKEFSSLINPRGVYDYSKLHYFIKRNFRNYSSFWTNNTVEMQSFIAQIGFSRKSPVKCNKFENITFKYGQDECNKSLGFICEKPIIEGVLNYQIDDKKFYIQSEKQFTCGQAIAQCNQYNMSLLLYDDYFNTPFLENYIDLNYGSNARFWLANLDSYDQCVTVNEGVPIDPKAQFGFICKRTIVKSFLNYRHLVLILFVAAGAILAIIVFIILKYCLRNKIKAYISGIPEPVKKKSGTSF